MRRDRFGRILVAVTINGKGPYSLILDTGANHTVVSQEVAVSLGADLQQLAPTIMHGVTGSNIVPTIHVDSISVGEFDMPATTLPIVQGALEGADGYLSANSLAERRIVIDLKNDLMTLADRRSDRSDPRDVTFRAEASRARMLIIGTRVNGVPVKAIVDTGAQATIGNVAMQAAVAGAESAKPAGDLVVGATAATQAGTDCPLPPVALGSLRIVGGRIAYADLPIFSTLELASEPAMLIGMDILGQFESMSLDIPAQTLQLRPRSSAQS